MLYNYTESQSFNSLLETVSAQQGKPVGGHNVNRVKVINTIEEAAIAIHNESKPGMNSKEQKYMK